MPDRPVDLRSDTVTRPTPAMRRAMADAEVGDDGYGEDPTVNALEEVFAARLGKEASLFVPSGTMANQLALRVLARPGTSVIAGRRSHIVAYENGAGSYNSGAQIHAVDDAGGVISFADVAWAVEAAAHHQPTPSVLCLEDTYMPADGAVVLPEVIQELAGVARAAGMAVHLDGARLWNAAVSSGLAVSDFAEPVTTVMCCLSKGLCAPVGSLMAGPADVIAAARAHRQRLGGGMRQVGVLAAAGLVALETMVERLAEDHQRAAVLAQVVADRWPASDGGDGRAGTDAVTPGTDAVTRRTNVVTFAHPDPESVIGHLAAHGVLAGTIAPGVVRLVTHRDVDDAGVERARRAIAEAP